MKIITFIFWVIVLPLILVVILFWNYKIALQNFSTPSGFVEVIQNQNIKDNILDDTRAIFQTPFDLSSYKVCLINRSKLIPAIGNEVDIGVNVFLTDEKGATTTPDITIPKNGETCIDTKQTPFFIGVKNLESIPVHPDILAKNATTTLGYSPNIYADTTTGAQPTFKTKIISSLIFIFAYLGILKLINDYINWFIKIIKKSSKK